MDNYQVASLVISIALAWITLGAGFYYWREDAKAIQRRHEEVALATQQRHEEIMLATQKRHRETVVLPFLAGWQRGDDQDLLALETVRRQVEELERDGRALGSTGKSILGAAVPAVVGSGDPSATNQDDNEVSEGESVCASLLQSPASHGGPSLRRRFKSPDKPAAMPSPLGSTAPAWGGTRSSRESAEMWRRADSGLEEGSFLPM
jgi:hypothetical protein